MTDSLTAKQLQAKLTELKARTYIPARMVSLITAVSQVQHEMHEKINPRPLKPKATPAQHSGGAPLVLQADFGWNKKQAEQFFKKMLKSVTLKDPKQEDSISQGAAALADLLAAKKLDLHAALAAVLAGDAKFFDGFSKKTPGAPDLLYFLCSSTLAPFVEKQAMHLMSLHTESIWKHGHCPICGGLPFMGKLEGKEGNRLHTCSFCHVSYRVPRLQCGFCLQDHPEGTPMYTADEDRFFHIYPCESCKSYIKLADFRELDRVYLPAIDDVISLPFDIKAREMGYARPAKSAWGI